MIIWSLYLLHLLHDHYICYFCSFLPSWWSSSLERLPQGCSSTTRCPDYDWRDFSDDFDLIFISGVELREHDWQECEEHGGASVQLEQRCCPSDFWSAAGGGGRQSPIIYNFILWEEARSLIAVFITVTLIVLTSCSLSSMASITFFQLECCGVEGPKDWQKSVYNKVCSLLIFMYIKYHANTQILCLQQGLLFLSSYCQFSCKYSSAWDLYSTRYFWAKRILWHWPLIILHYPTWAVEFSFLTLQPLIILSSVLEYFSLMFLTFNLL